MKTEISISDQKFKLEIEIVFYKVLVNLLIMKKDLCPISAAWRHRNCTYSRQQFPLLLAYGLTIHKGQGMTLDKLILDIGKLEKKTFTGLIFCNQVIKSSAMASPILESHESGTWQVWHLDHFQIWRGMIL